MDVTCADCEQLVQRRAKALEALKADGLTIGECITALAVPDDDPYVREARNLIADDDVEIDDHTVIAVVGDGAWVLSWLWVSKEEAGPAAISDR